VSGVIAIAVSPVARGARQPTANRFVRDNRALVVHVKLRTNVKTLVDAGADEFEYFH